VSLLENPTFMGMFNERMAELDAQRAKERPLEIWLSEAFKDLFSFVHVITYAQGPRIEGYSLGWYERDIDFTSDEGRVQPTNEQRRRFEPAAMAACIRILGVRAIGFRYDNLKPVEYIGDG
jgi:hypothetical protein